MDNDHLPSSIAATPGTEVAMARYLSLRQRFDRQILSCERRHQASLVCRPGCASCCTLESVLPIEAAILARAIAALADETRQLLAAAGQAPHADDAGSPCPLLVNGLCSVYEDRPFICRSHGLPVAYLDEHGASYQVSACPLNFSGKLQFTIDDLLLMDECNSRLREIDDFFCGDSAGQPDKKRIPLRHLCAGYRLPSPTGGT